MLNLLCFISLENTEGNVFREYIEYIKRKGEKRRHKLIGSLIKCAVHCCFLFLRHETLPREIDVIKYI